MYIGGLHMLCDDNDDYYYSLCLPVHWHTCVLYFKTAITYHLLSPAVSLSVDEAERYNDEQFRA